LESEQLDGLEPELPGELGDTEGALDPEGDLNEIPPEGEDEPLEPASDWEKRYKDAQAEITRANMEREVRDSEFTESMASVVRMRHDIEDQAQQIEDTAGFFLTGLDQQISHMEQMFSTGQIEPERMGDARMQYQGLVQNKNGLMQHLNKVKQQRDEMKERRKSREAEIAQLKLKRSIPGFNRETYSSLRDYAVKRGFSVDEFNDSTDYRYFELLYDSMQLHSAPDTVQKITTRRPQRSKRGQRQPRDTRGRFEKAQREFHENPNKKGAFAAMKAEQLRKERSGR
jgi:hypothetical protein